MDYRKFGERYYIRMDRDDEIISGILNICKKENIRSAIFSGIGGCKEAEIQTFVPETGSFEEQHISGMLELASLNGNVVTDETGNYYHHTHAVFAYKALHGGRSYEIDYRIIYRRNRITPCNRRNHKAEIRSRNRNWILGF